MPSSGTAGGWATNTASDPDGASERAEPADAVKKRGLRTGEPVPGHTINWLFSQIPPIYTELSSAIAELPAGAFFRLDDVDPNRAPGTQIDGVTTSGSIDALAVDGRNVVVSINGGAITRYYANDLTNVVTTYTQTNAGTVIALVTTGAYVIAAYGQYVEVWDMDGVSQWVYDHGATVRDIDCDGVCVYLVGNAGTGSHEARGIQLAGASAGVEVWAYAHGAILRAVCCDGVRTYVGGDIASDGVALIGLISDTGFDATDRGGTGADDSGRAWEVSPDNAVFGIATNARELACTFGGTAPVCHLRLLAAGSGESLWDHADPDLYTAARTYGGVAIDQGRVFALVDQEQDVRAWSIRTGAEVWRTADYGVNRPVSNHLATDGSSIWLGLERDSLNPQNTVRRLSRGALVPRLWRRFSPGDRFLPMRRLAIPQEGS
ncbi:MAG: hypothetical protein AAFV53_33330 [Myxococcota bacterium]